MTTTPDPKIIPGADRFLIRYEREPYTGKTIYGVVERDTRLTAHVVPTLMEATAWMEKPTCTHLVETMREDGIYLQTCGRPVAARLVIFDSELATLEDDPTSPVAGQLAHYECAEHAPETRFMVRTGEWPSAELRADSPFVV